MNEPNENLEMIFRQEYKELINELHDKDPKDWGIILPRNIKQEFKSFKIHRSKFEKRSLEGTWLNLNSELHIDWAIFITEIIDSSSELVSSDLITHFFLINFIDLQHTEKEQLFSTFFKRITLELKNDIRIKIVEVINSYPWNRLEKVDFEDKQSWQLLIKEFEYAFSFFTPLTTLHTYFKYCIEYDHLSMIIALNNYAFSLFISMGVFTYKIWSQFNDLILSLRDNRIPVIRLTIYISNMPDFDFQYLEISKLQILAEKYWEEVGIEFFRKFYCHPNRNYSVEAYSSHKLKFMEIINKWNTEREYCFINNLQWPKDFQGLVRVLFPFNENEDHQIDFHPELLHSISKNLLNYLQKNECISLLSDRFLPSKILDDPLDRDMFIAICMSMNAIMESDDGLYTNWKKQLKKWMFFIRPLFYSGYEGKRIAKITVEIILVFLTSTASLTDVSKSSYLRIKELLDLITTNILYPFIRYTEHDEDIWNYDRKLMNLDKKYYNSKELYLINHNLKLITETDNEQIINTFNKFCSKWKMFAQARWPWFDSKIDDE